MKDVLSIIQSTPKAKEALINKARAEIASWTEVLNSLGEETAKKPSKASTAVPAQKSRAKKTKNAMTHGEAVCKALSYKKFENGANTSDLMETLDKMDHDISPQVFHNTLQVLKKKELIKSKEVEGGNLYLLA